MTKQHIFRYAFKKSVPVMLGYIFLGIAYGIVLTEAGFSWLWTLPTSILIYAGSMEFALVPLLYAVTPLPTVALMTLLVNSRHLFYGISFVDIYRSMGAKYPYMIFSLTDETYSVLVSCLNDAEFQADHHSAAFWVSVLHHCYWVTGSVIGGLLGQVLPFDATGIDFSMTALFVVILVDQLRGNGKQARMAALMGIAVAVIMLLALGADRFLLPTLIVTVALLMLTNRTGAEKEAAK